MKAKILYVEDDDSLSFITKDQLEMESYDVTHSANGKDAWSIFKKGEFDLCLLDVMLPQMDGFELAKKIRAVSKHVPIIFLTAKSMVEDKMEGFLLGGDDYVTKPYSFEELKMRIDVFLRRRKIIEEAPKEAIIIGKYNFDYANLDLSINGTSNGLTQREADILYYLAAQAKSGDPQDPISSKISGARMIISTDVVSTCSSAGYESTSMKILISRLRMCIRLGLNSIFLTGKLLSEL